MKKVALHTLGCKLNYAETSTICKQFLEKGFQKVSFKDNAEVYVLNTCTVSKKADRECLQIIRNVLRKNPNAYLIVTGCYAQLQSDRIASTVGVDAIIGCNEKYKIFDFIKNFEKEKYPKIFVDDINKVEDFETAYSNDTDCRTRAFLKIQDGCDYNCSFCTIPLARGKSRSQPIDITLSQAKLLASKGFKEIVLSGVNLGDYGRKINTTFFSLLKELVKIEQIERLRISSIEPNLLSTEIIDFVLENNILCNHFHIPLQSASDEILKNMCRRYTVQDYEKLILYIKSKDPNTAIGTDVIVGYPGENDNHFEETYKFLAQIPISYIHVFSYSERPNTLAAISRNVVDLKIRNERNKILRSLSDKKKSLFYSQFLGKTFPVLYEGKNKKGRILGWTSNYIRVSVQNEDNLINKIVPTTIVKNYGEFCEGEPQH